jgi:hypothetical protein
LPDGRIDPGKCLVTAQKGGKLDAAAWRETACRSPPPQRPQQKTVFDARALDQREQGLVDDFNAEGSPLQDRTDFCSACRLETGRFHLLGYEQRQVVFGQRIHKIQLLHDFAQHLTALLQHRRRQNRVDGTGDRLPDPGSAA